MVYGIKFARTQKKGKKMGGKGRKKVIWEIMVVRGNFRKKESFFKLIFVIFLDEKKMKTKRNETKKNKHTKSP